MGHSRLEHAIEYVRGTENRYLIFAEGGHAQAFAPDSAAWFAWLDALPSFHFQGKAGQFSACQERKQRGAAYWYAYRKANQVRIKRYLGTTDKLTLAKLEETANALHEEALGTIGEEQVLNARPAKPPPDGLQVGSLTVLWHDEVLRVTTPMESYILNRRQTAELLHYLYHRRGSLLKPYR
jgi:hypothetical protein